MFYPQGSQTIVYTNTYAACIEFVKNNNVKNVLKINDPHCWERLKILK